MVRSVSSLQSRQHDPLARPAFVADSDPDPSAAPRATILHRLRHETRAEHDAIEIALNLTSPTLSRHHYCQQLEWFYGFYSPLEAALQRQCVGWTSAWLSHRLVKTSHLSRDLHYFGVDTVSLPLCRELPRLASRAELLGCLYVIEGATLGGRVVGRHIDALLDITPARGGRFFHGYGDDAARQWQEMRQVLLAQAIDTEIENKIVDHARAAFASLRRWCEKGKDAA